MIMANHTISSMPREIAKNGWTKLNMVRRILIPIWRNLKRNALIDFFILRRNTWRKSQNGLWKNKDMEKMIQSSKIINAQRERIYYPIKSTSNCSIRLRTLKKERKNFMLTSSKISIANLEKYLFNNPHNFGKH